MTSEPQAAVNVCSAVRRNASCAATIAANASSVAGGCRAGTTPEVTASVRLEQPQFQASELMISAALHGYRLAEVPTTMRDRGDHATRTKKGTNLSYGISFAKVVLGTWWRDRRVAKRTN